MPLITIIIPIYNVAEYLPRCLDSILQQTHKNLEIILINDGSADDSGKICDNYATKDNRIKVIHQQNEGVSAARNVGLTAATGLWIGFADPDDFVQPTLYETLISQAEKTTKPLAICGFTKHHADGRVSQMDGKNISETLTAHETLDIMLENYDGFGGFVWNKLFNCEVLNSANIRFNPMLHAYQDLVFVVQFVLAAETATFVNMPLYDYFMREGGTTLSFSQKKLSALDAVAEVINLMPTETLQQKAKAMHTATAVEFLILASRFGGTEYISQLKKAAKIHKTAFFASGYSRGIKLRAFITMAFPMASQAAWRTLKSTFNITWWHKNFREVEKP